MKKIIGIIFCVVLVAGTLVIVGCSRSEEHGQAVSDTVVTTIQEILTAPQRYADRLVKVKGKIVTECPTGCWFEVHDGTGILYVDTKGSGFAIPQRVGKQVTVEGTISDKHGKSIMEGQGAKIQ